MNKIIPRVAGLALTATLFMGSHASFGQGAPASNKGAVPRVALEHLKKNKQALQLSDEDLADVVLSSESSSKKSGLRHLYLQQRYQGIEIHNAITNVSLTKDEQVVQMGNRFEKQLAKKVKAKGAKMTAQAAVAAAAKHLNLSLKQPLSVQRKGDETSEAVLFSKGGISLEPIPAHLVYQPMSDGSLRLAWEVTIYELDAHNWWNVRVDAATGEFLDKDNMVSHCEFDNNGPLGVPFLDNSAYAQAAVTKSFNFATVMASTSAGATYNVYAMPFESPSHGPLALRTGADADKKASPAGWHTAGSQSYTTTRGNNVYAYEDPDNTGYAYASVPSTLYSPDGGSSLSFNFPVDPTKQPEVNRDAAITNLFYWNNVIHDVWYQYGFDEQSGSFQVDNFGKTGLGNDPVMAEAQDSRNILVPPPGVTTRNNANFGTPPDGTSPRMQMYLWNGIPDPDMFKVTGPSGIAKSYPTREASFAKRLTPNPVIGKLVLGTASTGVPEQACGPLVNAAAVAGNIAVVYRGTCSFANKVQNAQIAGAIAVLVINNQAGLTTMGGAPTNPVPAINIPAVMITQADGAIIRSALDEGTEVTVALKNDNPELDSDFDNGIIAHEYGHGISNRLTGGPNTTSCLPSQVVVSGVAVSTEQMGEGWSDYIGLTMTMSPNDTGAKARGIGTYASGQPTTGLGIRPAPYSTSLLVNGFTYAATNNPAISAPHGVGFVWATMLWDMTWDMINKYGFSEDLYSGTKGNNMAMQLVVDGMKLQPCRPGFVDGRNAILLADRINYGGANQELIWKAFAKRGLGFSAKQGSSTSRFDQVEAFDLPATYLCTTPLAIDAVQTSTVFTGGDAKALYIGYGPQSVTLQAKGDVTNKYTWSPAAGLSDATIANPVFTASTPGTFTFTVKAVNADQCTKTTSITIKVIDVRCGSKNNKVSVCFKGKQMCVDAADATALLTRERSEAVIGACGVQARGTGDGAVASAPLDAALTVAPNPASAKTTLAFTLTQTGAYRLEVVNTLGAVVAVVAQGNGEAGEAFSHEFSRGNLAAGLYVARLVSGGKSHFTRIVLQD